MQTPHTPVLLAEVIQLLSPQSGNTLLDATLGHGGHAAAYLKATSPDGTVVGLDADPQALAVAQKNLAQFEGRVTYINANFANIKDSLNGGGILKNSASTFTNSPPDAKKLVLRSSAKQSEEGYTHIIFDLGLGSHQIADEQRGFSFTSGTGLSMRYGDHPLPPSSLQSLNWLEARLQRLPDVVDIIQRLRQEELSELIRKYGEERFSGRIARVIKENAPRITGAKELAEVISAAVPAQYRAGRIHPATRTFQALRLAVNRELESLQTALPQAVDLLEPGGRMAVISFHSLEDRIVKQYFKEHSAKETGTLKILTKKPVTAAEEETSQNPRSRSAKLRVAQKNK